MGREYTYAALHRHWGTVYDLRCVPPSNLSPTAANMSNLANDKCIRKRRLHAISSIRLKEIQNRLRPVPKVYFRAKDTFWGEEGPVRSSCKTT